MLVNINTCETEEVGWRGGEGIFTSQRFAYLVEVCFYGFDQFFLAHFDAFLEGVPVFFDAEAHGGDELFVPAAEAGCGAVVVAVVAAVGGVVFCAPLVCWLAKWIFVKGLCVYLRPFLAGFEGR